MEVTKQQRAFYRKLYLGWLVTQEEHSATSLQKLTGMPRRTIQDTLKDMSDIGISLHFQQIEGGRHNAGFYVLESWGPIRPEWISANLPQIEQALEISTEAG